MNDNFSKIINIKSEVLCRSAEDDFFYFFKVNSAYKKLKEAVRLSPMHLKSIILLADVNFIKGKIKTALNLYLRAVKINSLNIKALASIANCFYILRNYNQALIYCDKVIFSSNHQNYALFLQIFEIKINILIMQKQYKQAYITLENAKQILKYYHLKSFENINYQALDKKINLQKKLQKSSLKIV